MVVQQRKSKASLTTDPFALGTHAEKIERQKLMCCAQYRPADLVELLSRDTHVYEESPRESATITDRRCWHCTFEFEGEPWRLPITRKGPGSFSCVGIFCSPSCAAGWGMIRNDYQMSQAISWLRMEARRRSPDRRAGEFAVAPPTHWLKCYGGTLSIDKFRNIGSKGIVYIEKASPFVSRPLVLERLQESVPPPKTAKPPQKRIIRAATAASETTTQSRGLYHDFIEKTMASGNPSPVSSPVSAQPTAPLGGMKRKANTRVVAPASAIPVPPRTPTRQTEPPERPQPLSPVSKPGTLLGLLRKRGREPTTVAPSTE